MKTDTRRKASELPVPHTSRSLAGKDREALDQDQLHALLFEALETEKGGVRVYEAALRCAIDDGLIKEWKRYLNQTTDHVTILTNVLKKIGLNPDQETPGRNVVRHAGMSLVKTIEIAAMAGKPDAAQIVAAECVVQAETKDHLNWELIGAAADSLTGTIQEVLKEAYDQVEDEEDEHLYHTTGWARELHLQALGLPAELPPAEEVQDVKTEAEAAEVRKDRKEKLTSTKKEDRSEEGRRQQSAEGQDSRQVRQKKQNRRSAA